MLNRLKYILVVIYVAIGSVVWFGDITLGGIKTILLIGILILNYKFFLNRKNYIAFKYFLISILLISVVLIKSNLGNNFNYVYFYFGYFENYLMFIFGYYFSKKNKIDSNLFNHILYIIIPFCLIIICNYLFNVPHWFSPYSLSRYDDLLSAGVDKTSIEPLYSTGFGLGRTGWANTLSQYLAISFSYYLYNKSSRKFYLFYILLFGTIFISGSRGGILISLVITILMMKYFSTKYKFVFMLLIFAFSLIIFMDLPSVETFLRLNSNDISTGRTEQIALSLPLLLNCGLWGLGINSIKSYLSNYNIDYTVHNTYLKLFIEYGWVFGIFLISFCVSIIYRIFIVLKCYEKKHLSNELLTSCLVLICGFISCLFEPGSIFGSVNWWVIWWFSLGIFIHKYKIEVHNENNCNS